MTHVLLSLFLFIGISLVIYQYRETGSGKKFKRIAWEARSLAFWIYCRRLVVNAG